MKLRIEIALLCLCSSAVLADYKADIGYTSLQARLGGSTPNGAGIDVTQVEAPSCSPLPCTPSPPYIYLPDLNPPSNPQFSGKTITPKCASCNNTSLSSHATTVGTYYYGITTSVAPAIATVDANEANNWINSSLLPSQPSAPLTELRRIENHSWIGSTGNSATDADILRRIDLMINRDGVLVCAGANNGAGSAMPQLMASAYNTMTVGLTNGGASYGPTLVDVSGRAKPDIVVPTNVTSWATPIVAASGALLLQTADANNILSSLIASQRKIAKVMLVKALLMEGATKEEFGTTAPNAWRKGFATPTTDGSVPLDYRYGAGELNIDNSHRILTANPPNYEQNASSTSLVALVGWDYASFTTAGTKQYFIETPSFNYISEISILVTWHRHVSRSGSTLTPTLANIDLRLYDATGFTRGSNLLDQSVSAIDNVEYILLKQIAGGRYVFEVTSDLAWDYAIAWNVKLAPATLPPDLNGDGAVDSNDVAIFIGCVTGPDIGPPHSGCGAADFDGDNDVDLDDFARLQRCLNGTGVIADPACVN